ncbi:MAG: ABC transporter ATP-binding protein [Balneolales bacterium]
MDIQSPALSLKSITKSYGDNMVLEGVDLQIETGSCYGLLGNNGAGKSTLINTIIDLTRADSGEVMVFGKKYSTSPLWIKSKIGVLPEQELLNSEFSGMEQLRFTGLLYGLEESDLLARIKALYNYFFDNENDLYKACGSYSTGMRKKLGLIAAVLHKPSMLILDEPFSGLDPLSSQAVIRFLKTYLTPERTILLSSHNLSHVEQAATHVGVLHNKKLAFSGLLSEFTVNGTNQVEQSMINLLKTDEKSTQELERLLS